MTAINTVLFWIILIVAAMGWIIAGLLWQTFRMLIRYMSDNTERTAKEILKFLKK